MRTFLHDVIEDFIRPHREELSKITFVLPSKRAGNFLKNLIATEVDYDGFAPLILSIEEFITEVTQLHMLDHTQSLFQFYDTYNALTPKEQQEDFDTFSGWAQTLLYDFNEIDRYLIDPQGFFGNLGEIQQLEHWSLASPQTDLVKNYLAFWNKLPEYHAHFVDRLLTDKKGYQGLVYRQAAQEVNTYLQQNDHYHLFIGFNALNNAEQKIIQQVLEQNRGKVIWDIDTHFLETPHHGAGLFMRRYQKEWPFYAQRKQLFEKPSAYYLEEKHIEAVGIPKNIGQAKYVGNLLEKLDPQKTAVILNDEALLLPVLNALPDKIKGVNITMGLLLENTPPASLFEILFKIQLDEHQDLYYKNVMEVLNHPNLKLVEKELSQHLQKEIIEQNLVYLPKKKLLKISNGKANELLEICFTHYQGNILIFLEKLIRLTHLLRPEDFDSHRIETQYLYHFHNLFNKLKNLLEAHTSTIGLKGLYHLYRDLLKTESIDFSGSPFDGLQVMGMLETRVLDFDTIVLTSVNEGILPTGKSSNSFIPHDLKVRYGLPTYREKDAVYTYHFYRLLQRAKNIYLLYNSQPGDLNSGEKSRFLAQLEVEKAEKHHLIQKLASFPTLTHLHQPAEIQKTPEVLEILKEKAKKGFSPSALTSYIRNPLEFYQNYVLKIREDKEVEETIALNTLGTAVHDTLENFYKPWIGKTIQVEALEKMQKNIDFEVRRQFTEGQNVHITQGKNLIIFEVAKRFVHNFLNAEKELLQSGQELKILYIENEELRQKLAIPELDFPVYLSGRVDRVDALNGNIRVVDYKTGFAEEKHLKIKDWDELIQDYEYSKAFQVLSYASLLLAHKKYEQVQAGIISFKNMKSGFIPFTDASEKNKLVEIDSKVLNLFHEQVKKLILEIFNPEIPFIEKEV